jgi:hypothetical protein
MVLLQISWIPTDIEMAADVAWVIGGLVDWRFDRDFRLPR